MTPTETSSILPATLPPPPAARNTPPRPPLVVKLIALGSLMFMVGLFGGYGLSRFRNDSPQQTVSQQALPASTTRIDLPQTANEISACFAGRGKQYILPEYIPTGPIYNVQNGQVIGLEFMIDKKELDKGIVFANLPLYKVAYDHLSIEFLSDGHAGLPGAHYHIDTFTVPYKQTSAITCSGTNGHEHMSM